MDDAKSVSVSFSNLLFKVTALENELSRHRVESSKPSPLPSLLQKSDAIRIQNSDLNGAHELKDRADHGRMSVESQKRIQRLTDENAAVLEELENKKREISHILRTKDATRVQLKIENEELRSEIHTLREQCVQMEGELSCQKILATAMESELRTLKSEHLRLREALVEQEHQTKSCAQQLQASLVDTDSLIQHIEEQHKTMMDIESQLQTSIVEQNQLRRDLISSKAEIETSERKAETNASEINDLYDRLRQEQEHKVRLVTVLRSSEEHNIKIENTMQNQVALIEKLQETLKQQPATETESLSTAGRTSGKENHLGAPMKKSADGYTATSVHGEPDAFIMQQNDNSSAEAGALEEGR